MKSSICLFVFGTVLVCSQAAEAVDGVIEINQTAALAGGITPGDGPGYPVTLSTSGSYRLTGNLSESAGVGGIAILAADVTLDLNGFTLAQADGLNAGTGVQVEAAAHGVKIHNGTIRGFTQFGLFLSPGVQRACLSDLHVLESGLAGILAQAEGSVVEGCSAAHNVGIGIRGFPGSPLVDNVAYANGAQRLVLNDVLYGGNAAYDNNGGNGNTQINSNRGAQSAPNLCGLTVCP